MESSALDDDVLIEVRSALDHFNGSHADTMLLVARFAGGCAEAVDAEGVSVDTTGMDFAVRTAAGDRAARVEFPSSVSTYADVQGHFLAKVTEARANAGTRVPITSLERELRNRGSLPTHIAHVAEVCRLTPNLVEITLEGGFEEFRSEGGDQFLYLMVPRSAGAPVPVDHTMAAQMEADPGDAPLAAYYTARRWEPDAGRLTLWAVLHGHGHDDCVGAWAGRCTPGERVALWGPREGMGARASAKSHLFVADESGIAAVAALLDELPADVVGHVVLEAVDADHVLDLPDRAGIATTWVFRNGEAPGVTNRLLDAVKELDLDVDGMVAFGAAESRQITETRKYLRTELDMSAQDVYMTGYWRR